ncbi:hypothetical protein NE236_22785 [Actinoallomurus purpureus]|uniref:hypothetical protein n=1 Tax=Actinoallomurus purpureus TaxID=478114 RepID=UPI002092749B|nr:hypothetical protein [Actinoallomurus purpureus]MCO6007809.1 hypothetical protein [Actinoallomurus purpureus]
MRPGPPPGYPQGHQPPAAPYPGPYQPAYQQPGWPGPERVAPHLGLRLMRRDALPAGYDAISIVLSDEIFGLLCVREEGREGVRPVGAADAHRWGSDPRTLWGWGLDNLRREDLDVRSDETVAGNALHIVTGPSGTASAQLLRIGELLREPASFGLLLTVPVDGVLIFMVLRSHADLAAVPSIHETSRSVARTGAMLSDRVYWWYQGAMEDVPITVLGAQQARISPRPGLHRMLQHLPR